MQTMEELIKQEVVSYNTESKTEHNRIKDLVTKLKGEYFGEELVELYKKAMFTNHTSALPIIMHSIAVAYTKQDENKGQTITDFQHLVRESIAKDPVVSAQESARVTANMYLNTSHIDPNMKDFFMREYVESQKGNALLGFREIAKKDGDLGFFEKIKNYAETVASKYKNSIEGIKNTVMPSLSSLTQKLESNQDAPQVQREMKR